ncbi:MAG TPA: hypothetical protein VKH37_13200 [Ferruginibacter sp.]|nr:hypothetical protein [Ferruginibacter sp.]
MKKLIISILTILIVSAADAQAQLRIDLFLNATPPANLTEWGTRKEVLQAIVPPSPGLNVQAKIKTEVKLTDGTMVGTTDLARSPIFTLGSAPLILSAVDVLPLEDMIFTGKYKNSLDKTGKLPSDNYMLCVQLVRPMDYTPMSAPTCKPFYVAATQLPVLMMPYNEQILDGQKAQTAIMFRWTPVLPRTTSPVTYRIQVFEVLNYQTPVQAVRANQPLLDRELINVTQFIWSPQLSFIENADITTTQTETYPAQDKIKREADDKTKNMRRFVWTIQTLDQHGDPIVRTDGSGEARSDPSLFFVKPIEKKTMKTE